MDALAYDLKRLAVGSGEGSFTTRKQRHRGLQLIARELSAAGYRLPSAQSLKPKHIASLVETWKAAGLSAGTIKNRLSWIRYWASAVRKTSVLPRDNAEVGVERRTSFKGNRAHATPAAALGALPERMRLALRLQMAFGLRLEESLKFTAAVADQGDRLTLKPSWCKGGRAREIPITHPRQRELLDEVRRTCRRGSVIPEDTSYIAFRKDVEKTTWGLGIRNLHGHRHWYAQWRYRSLTGWAAPAAGGPTYETLSAADRAADYRARMAISRELGHNRLEITDVYLGRRFAGKKAT